jgi:hypothetical protein
LVRCCCSRCPRTHRDGLVTYKSLAPEVALELARATLATCRERGFQVAAR